MNNKEKWGITSRTISNILVVCSGVLLYWALANISSARSYLSSILSVVSPFIVAIGIAYLLNMPLRFFENKFYYKLKFKRVLSIITVYALALIFMYVLLLMVIPQVAESISALLAGFSDIRGLVNSLPANLNRFLGVSESEANAIIEPYKDVSKQMMDYAKSILPGLIGATVQIGSSIISVFTAIIASIYMLASKEKLVVQLRRVLYAVFPRKFADETIRIGRLSNNVFSGFISGKLLDSLIIGIMCFVFMWVTNAFFHPMPFAALISIIIGIFNIIPFFGPFIGAIPSTLILLMKDPTSAIIFVIFIILLQQFDGNILGPKILGDSTGLPALWVLIAIIVGGGFFGFIGMILGVPTAAVLYTLASDILENRLNKKSIGADVYNAPEPEPEPAESSAPPTPHA